MAATPEPPGSVVVGDTSTMPTPTIVDLNASAALTERGHLAVQLFRVRDRIRALGPADGAWAADALLLLLAECRAAGAADGEGA